MKKLTFITWAFLMFVATGCASLLGLQSFSKCDFSFKNVGNVSVAGVSTQGLTSFSSMTLVNTGKILKAFTQPAFPLTFEVNINVKNPNPVPARLDGGDYILWIDNVKMTSGSISQQVNVAAGQTAVLAMPFTLDLKQVLKSENRDKIIDFCFGLATDNEAVSRVKVSLKPYFNVGSSVIKFPSYITVGGDKIMPQN